MAFTLPVLFNRNSGIRDKSYPGNAHILVPAWITGRVEVHAVDLYKIHTFCRNDNDGSWAGIDCIEIGSKLHSGEGINCHPVPDHPYGWPISIRCITPKRCLPPVLPKNRIFHPGHVRGYRNSPASSDLLNTIYGLRLNDFVSQYRMDYLSRKIATAGFHNLSMDGIADQAGFGLGGNLFNSIKKLKGVPPTDFFNIRKPGNP